ncbi:MAG: LptA/OstA family protein [Alphaproteobacteria bacterium]|nr:LptA/OstA family protein [Alphaproteobacteria bacterium]
MGFAILLKTDNKGIRMFWIASILMVSGVVAVAENAKPEPLTVVADEMSYNDKSKISHATGNAIATIHNAQGIHVLNAHKIIAYHDGNDVSKIIAEGEGQEAIRLDAPKYKVRAGHCVYEKATNNVVCTKCVHITSNEKNDEITGNRAVLNLSDHTYTISGGAEIQASAVIDIKSS